MRRMIELLLLLIASPLLLAVFLIVYLLVRINMGTPVFYRQDRGGVDETTFSLLKFRSLTDERGKDGALLPDEARMTPFGRRLRRYRLDELPSFYHILTGDLALVGPRPLLWRTINSHPLGVKRLAGKPGFTGLSQVSGNTFLTEQEKFALDCYYLKHQSLWLDLTILLQTIGVILLGEKRDEKLIGRARTQFPEFFQPVEGL